MDFNYNRNSEGTVKVMKSKGKKNNIKVVQQDKKHPAIKLEISLGDDGKSRAKGLFLLSSREKFPTTIKVAH